MFKVGRSPTPLARDRTHDTQHRWNERVGTATHRWCRHREVADVDTERFRRTGLAIALLLLLSFVFNGLYLTAGFQADEFFFLNTLREDPAPFSRWLGLWAFEDMPDLSQIWWFEGEYDMGGFWRPLPSLLFEGSIRLFGESALPLHLLSVAAHGLVAVLLLVVMPGIVLSLAYPFMYVPSGENLRENVAAAAVWVEEQQPDHVLILNTPGLYYTFYPPTILQFHTSRKIDTRVLSSLNGVVSVERVDSHSFVIRADRAGWLTNFFAKVLRSTRTDSSTQLAIQGLGALRAPGGRADCAPECTEMRYLSPHFQTLVLLNLDVGAVRLLEVGVDLIHQLGHRLLAALGEIGERIANTFRRLLGSRWIRRPDLLVGRGHAHADVVLGHVEDHVAGRHCRAPPESMRPPAWDGSSAYLYPGQRPASRPVQDPRFPGHRRRAVPMP